MVKNGNMTKFMAIKVTMTCMLALTYFMASKVTVSFMVGLTLFMTQKGHSVIRGRNDLLYDPIGVGDFCDRFDIVYEPKRSQGH